MEDEKLSTKGLTGYSKTIHEIMSFLEEEKSQDDFDSKYKGIIDEPYAVGRDSLLVLGTENQGMGPETWAGKLHLVQILTQRGFIQAKERDGKVYYKAFHKFP